MEERTNAKKAPRTADESGIVELTPEMALADQSQVHIIELTNAIDTPETASPRVTSTEQPVEAADAPKDVDKAPPPPSEPSDIEQEVDAAFEAAQIESAERAKAEAQQDQLLDRLSDLPDMVDSAVGQAVDTDSEAMEPAPSAGDTVETEAGDDADVSGQALQIDEPEFDEDQLALDAALIDEAMDPDAASADQQAAADDGIIELTDIVDPVEMDPETYSAPVTLETDQEDEELLELADSADERKRPTAEPDEDQDEIIELTDIVDPAEIQEQPRPEPGPDAAALEALQTDEEEIIELTEIVDPAELASLDRTTPAALDVDSDEDAIIELTDIVDPSLMEAQSPDGQLSARTEPDDDDMIELTDIVDPTELDPSELQRLAVPPASDGDVLHLTDVLGQPSRKSPSAADDAPSE